MKKARTTPTCTCTDLALCASCRGHRVLIARLYHHGPKEVSVSKCGECLMNDVEIVELNPDGKCPRCGTDYAVPTVPTTTEPDTICPDGPSCPDAECRSLRHAHGFPVTEKEGPTTTA